MNDWLFIVNALTKINISLYNVIQIKLTFTVLIRRMKTTSSRDMFYVRNLKRAPQWILYWTIKSCVYTSSHREIMYEWTRSSLWNIKYSFLNIFSIHIIICFIKNAKIIYSIVQWIVRKQCFYTKQNQATHKF